jgi:hypothetical protein|uniref:hypothetical protein n=1 Tax=Cephaloticoccus sp. TaxID=1985742 RepID=UPI004049A9AC
MKTNTRFSYMNLSLRTVRGLFVTMLVGLWGSLLMKFGLESEGPVLLICFGVLLLIGIGAGGLLFLSSSSFIAHAPEGQIDERELAERNRAYFDTVKLIALVILVAGLVTSFGERVGLRVTLPIMENFLMRLFLTTIVAPAGLLAWRQQTVENNTEE